MIVDFKEQKWLPKVKYLIASILQYLVFQEIQIFIILKCGIPEIPDFYNYGSFGFPEIQENRNPEIQITYFKPK